jgi:hypothetical protein
MICLFILLRYISIYFVDIGTVMYPTPQLCRSITDRDRLRRPIGCSSAPGGELTAACSHGLDKIIEEEWIASGIRKDKPHYGVGNLASVHGLACH